MIIKKPPVARTESLQFTEVSPLQVFEYNGTLFIKLDSNFSVKYFTNFQQNQDTEDPYCVDTQTAMEEIENYVRTHHYNAIRISPCSDENETRRSRLVLFDDSDLVTNINAYYLVHNSLLPENLR